MFELLIPILKMLKDTYKIWGIALLIIVSGLYLTRVYDRFTNSFYNNGYKAAQSQYELDIVNLKLSYNIAQKAQQAAYNSALQAATSKYQADTDYANKKTSIAEATSDQYKLKAAAYQSKLKEAIKNVPLNTKDVSYPFSVGFVGLFNLSIEGSMPTSTGTTSTVITDSEISKASNPNDGLTTLDITKPSKVSLNEILDVTNKNMAIANQCISDRKTMQIFIESLCKRGFCD